MTTDTTLYSFVVWSVECREGLFWINNAKHHIILLKCN